VELKYIKINVNKNREQKHGKAWAKREQQNTAKRNPLAL